MIGFLFSTILSLMDGGWMNGQVDCKEMND
jgi:hypothetical protein